MITTTTASTIRPTVITGFATMTGATPFSRQSQPAPSSALSSAP
jgi:hypothetical protein